MISSGISLMIMGMSIVFIFLMLIWIFTVLLAKFASENQSTGQATAGQAQNVPQVHRVVIAAAIAEHRRSGK